MDKIPRLIGTILLISLAIFIISIFQQEQLPDKKEVLDELYQEPLQTEKELTPFEVEREGAVYKIKPLFDYELYGLVVSYHNSSSWWDYYHKEWGDFINVKDICVIWGKNIESEVYTEMKFNSGSFTCYPSFRSGADYAKYDPASLSNNHLLPDDDRIFETIKRVKKGDQILLKGYLVEYSREDNSFKRGTSVSRKDTGNGACETIYVTDFEILKEGNAFWRDIHAFTKFSTIISFFALALYFSFGPTEVYRKG